MNRPGRSNRWCANSSFGHAVFFVCVLEASAAVTAAEDKLPASPLRQFTGALSLFSQDGRQVLSNGAGKGLHLYNATSGKEIRRFGEGTEPVVSLALSPDGNRALAGRGSARVERGKVVPGAEQVVEVWEVTTGKQLKRLKGHTHLVTSVSFSHDGHRALTGSMDGTIRLWELASGKEVRRFEGHTEAVRSAVFSPDDRRILSAGYDRTARLLDAGTGKQLCQFTGHKSWVTAADFLPGGRRMLTSSADKTLRLWDVQTGKEVRRLEGHTDYVWTAAVSADGRRALSGSGSSRGVDNTVRLWDLQTGRELRRFKGHEAQVMRVAFSPDGRRVLSSSVDGTTYLWALSK